MTQATGSITLRGLKVESSINGSSWTDISGWSNSVTIGGGEREIGEFITADGDTPILGAGKRGHIEVTGKVVYTEGAGDIFEVLRAAYEAASPFYLRFSPKGGASGQFMFTSDAGFIPTPIYPQGEVQSGEPVGIEFTLHTPKLTKTVVA